MSTTDLTPKPFEHVKQILRDAAKEKESAYGGLRLWEYSLDKLLEARLNGVLLIASERAAPSCCAHDGAAETKSRGDKSGLVQGLRGERPFDGTQFPPLPWGGQPVSTDDVQFIVDWINEGCRADTTRLEIYNLVPLAERPISIEVKDRFETQEPLSELTEYDVASSTEYKYQQGELKQRMNLDCMDETQVEKLRFAFRELYELNKWPEDIRNYNNLALIHQNHCQHGWERFLTWHRVYMYEFEQALQDRCAGVTLPYWDWTMPQYRPERPDLGWRIPKSLQAYLTKDSLGFLAKHNIPIDNLEGMIGRRFATLTQFFKEISELIGSDYTEGDNRNRFIDAMLDANSLWYPLRYPGEYHDDDGNPSTINAQIHYHYPSADDIEQILSLRTFRDFGGGSLYNDAFGFLDQNPHNTMHIWTGGQNPHKPDKPTASNEQTTNPTDRNKVVQVSGRKFHKREDLYTQPVFGDMFSNLTASYDPVFWPVHSNVDRLWWEWQQRHPDSLPDDLDAVLTPWSYTARDTLDIYRFGYEYVKSSCIIPVGTEVPVGRFVSKPIEIKDTVRDTFQQVEVRLHRVPQLPRSCFIRIFLNVPDANFSTPLDNPGYGGYLAIFGHGGCYGGPGHCDVPPLRRREYDVRPRSHNTPRNHRINVTKCVKRLFEAGAQSLQIALVVIGVDYKEENELLRLEGVSLNFLD